MTAQYVEIPGSNREPPVGTAPIASVHATNPRERIEVSVYVKDEGGDPLLKMKPGAVPSSTTESTAAQDSAAFDKVRKFASEAGLSVVLQDPARRLIKLAGPADKLEAAFRTKLHYYNDGKNAFRARSGSLSAPADVVDSIEAVLGLDTRPIAKQKLTRVANPHVVTGHLPNEVGRFYNFPQTKGLGAGQCIALIELGGGYRDSDNRLAFETMRLPVPTVTAISVSGGGNNPGPDPDADGEVALDIQVAGGAAPGAKIAVYFAPNTIQGFVDAITRAVNDAQNRPSVISISWGSPESKWTGQGLAAMNSALKDAATRGVTVFAAAGDNLATDGVGDGHAHVDFPASSPYAVGCGGTLIDTANGKIRGEAVWNNGGSGTGGGISDRFDAPGYQANVKFPPSVNPRRGPGRGVPDVAGDADPQSGYRIVVAGSGATIGGTSAVAPLWAGLIALINEECGRPLGFIQPYLYGAPQAFSQITKGDNKDNGIGYSAGGGWNACTGLGAPKGEDLLGVFKVANRGSNVPVS